MLMSLDDLATKYDMRGNVRGILHGGAHLAEEAPDYERVFGSKIPVCWVEANPAVEVKILCVLSSYQNQFLVMGALCELDHATANLNVTNYDGMSSSFFEFGTHPEFSPDTVFEKTIPVATRTIDSIVQENRLDMNMLMLDIQGAEMVALRGAIELLPKLDYVMLEVNRDEVYVGCAKVWDLDDFLLAYGLKRVETYWVEEQGWGDALWIRR